MSGYKNLKLKSKLMLAFMVMAIIAIVIGVVGIVSMNSLRQEDKEMYEENTMPMGELATMYDTLASQRICAANVVIFYTSNPTFSADEREALLEKEELFEAAFATYKDTITTEDEQALYDEMERLYFGDFAEIKTDLRAAMGTGDVGLMADEMKLVDDMGAEISGYMDEAFALNVGAAETKVNANQTLASTSSIVQFAVVLVGFVIAIVFAFFLSSVISKPLNRIMKVMKQVGDTGDMEFTQDVVAQVKADATTRDELGVTAGAFAKMMDALIGKSKVLEQVAMGDLTVQVNKASDRDTLGNAMDLMVNKLNDMFAEINSSTVQVSTGSSQITGGAQILAQSTTEQAATVQELAANISDIAEQTRTNALRAEQASNLSQNIKQDAQHGTEQMARMTQAVGEIDAASQSISAVIKVIDDIAFQTNILALNAAVEAARAGQYGKGFAVVAEEVRNLASKSADAAKETEQLIENTVEKAGLGAQIAKETSESLDAIVRGINESTEVIEEIAASSNRQSASIRDINRSIDQVGQVVQNTSSTAEESAAAAEEMSTQATVLKGMVDNFRLRDSAYTAAHQRESAPDNYSYS